MPLGIYVAAGCLGGSERRWDKERMRKNSFSENFPSALHGNLHERTSTHTKSGWREMKRQKHEMIFEANCWVVREYGPNTKIDSYFYSLGFWRAGARVRHVCVSLSCRHYHRARYPCCVHHKILWTSMSRAAYSISTEPCFAVASHECGRLSDSRLRDRAL